MVVHQSGNSLGNYHYNIYTYQNGSWADHFHKSFELIYILDGELSLSVNGDTTVMHKGEFALVLPNEIHSFSTPESSLVWVGVFSEDFVKEFAKKIKGKRGKSLCFKCSDTELEFLRSTLFSGEKQDILSLKACLYIVCSRYLKEITLISFSNKNSDLAHRIIDFTEKNFRENISLADVAEALGYEYHYFSRCFKRLFNMNFKTFLNHYKFNYAKELMLNTDMSLSEIAMESGFGSLRNFNRIYLRFANETPKTQKG